MARDFLPPGRRLGLPEDAYDVGERGCDLRALAGLDDQGRQPGRPAGRGPAATSSATDGERLLLRDAVAADPGRGHGRGVRRRPPGRARPAGQAASTTAPGCPYHVHPPQEFAALVGRNAKDESYYFPAGVDMGAHPESFFGVHPWIAERRAHDVLLPYLVDWDSDLILRHARAELQVAGRGLPRAVRACCTRPARR